DSNGVAISIPQLAPAMKARSIGRFAPTVLRTDNPFTLEMRFPSVGRLAAGSSDRSFIDLARLLRAFVAPTYGVAFQRRMLPSPLAERSVLPSGVKCTQRTETVCPRSVPTS